MSSTNLFYRFLMMIWSSIQRLFIFQVLQAAIKILIILQMEDFFAEVALQLEVGCGQFACQASLEKVEESQCRLSEQSWLSLTNQCSDGGLNSRSLLKRRPSKSNKKSRKRDSDDRLSETQIMPRKPGAAVDSKNLDRQLSQLQKTLQYPKNSSLNPRFQRQKVLIKRLNINKENVFARVKEEKEEKESFNVTSKFLQEIKEVDEELYEIYLNLYRFYEKEKEENAEIAKEIKEAMKNVEGQTTLLDKLKLEISENVLKIQQQKLKDKQMDVKFMKNLFSKQMKL